MLLNIITVYGPSVDMIVNQRVILTLGALNKWKYAVFHKKNRSEISLNFV